MIVLVKHKSLLHICVLENKLRYTYRWYMCQNVPKFSWCQFRCQFQFDFLILNVECVRDLICCDQMLKQMQWCLHTFLFCIVGNSSVDHKYSEVGFDRRLVFCLSGKCNRCNTGKLYRMYLRKSGQDCYSISCLERPLAWETTCFEGPLSFARLHFSLNEPVTKDHVSWDIFLWPMGRGRKTGTVPLRNVDHIQIFRTQDDSLYFTT